MPIARVQTFSCPKCGAPMILRKGKWGEFWGCSTYPRCKKIVSVGDEHLYNRPEKEFYPSSYQQDIFDFIKEGEGSAVVQGVAGCGKTTTLVQGGKRVPFFLGLAFNKHIADEWGARSPKADISTTHSFGLKVVREAFGRVKVDDSKVYYILKPMVEAQKMEFGDSRALMSTVKKVVALSKATLSKDFEWICDRYGIPTNGDAQLVNMLARYALEQDKKMTNTVDFGDMIWFPYVHHLQPKQYPFVFVDEAQDLNWAQAELISSALEPGGRVVLVGDKNQALYGFRGADADSIPNLIERFQAQTLPLSITYRCPKAVVELAQTLVPQIEAAPDAIDGEVLYQREREALKGVGPGDMILCRTNAPLVAPIYSLIQRGVKATIRGRDIGKGLITLIEKFEPKIMSSSLNELLGLLVNYERVQVGRLMSTNKTGQAQAVQDKVETIVALSDGVESIGDLKTKTESIFDDRTASVVGSTVHRAKGLEADKVIIIRPDLMPHPLAQQSWEEQAEQNCIYVACTRAKKTLIFAQKE